MRVVRALLWSVVLIQATDFAGAQPVQPPKLAAWLTPSLTYDGSAVANLRGGARTGSAYVGNLHLKLSVDADSSAWPGTSAFADVLNIHGGHPSRLSGDAQGVSNIEGPSGTQIEELWIQHNFAGGGVSVLTGIYDLNSEFYRLQSAGLFQNSAFGIGPEFAQSGVEGPSIFPRTSAGMRLDYKPVPHVVLRAALLDGVPVVRPDGSRAVFANGDGLLSVVEVAFLSREQQARTKVSAMRDRIGRFSSLSPYDDKLAIGAWRYSGRYPDLSDVDAAGKAVSRRGSAGMYIVVEHLLLGSGKDTGERLAAFAQAGVADPRTNRFGSHLSAGLVGSGWGLLTASDQIGAAITRSNNGSHYRRSQAAQNVATTSAETTVELTYLAQVSKHLTVQPDLQYVRHPDTDPSLAAAWVLQLRFELSF